MPVVSGRKTRTPAGSDAYNLTTDLRLMGMSISAIVPVASTSERAAVVAAMAAEGAPVGPDNPLVVHRADAAVGREFEFTVNGSTWRAIMSDAGDDWTAITSFGASMAANSFGLSPRVKRFSDGMTRMAGGVRRTSGSISAGDVLCTLPVGFAPPAFIEGVGATNQNGASVVRVEVQTDGTIRPLWGTLAGSITWVSFDSLQWAS